MRKLRHILFFIIVTLVVSSCASVIQKPEISINNVDLGYVSLKESSATFTLNVRNPNGFAIYLSGIEYALSLNGISVADGENADKIKIAAKGEETIEIPIRLRVGEMVKMIPTFLRERQVKYELDGKVKTPVVNIPFYRVGGIGVSE